MNALEVRDLHAGYGAGLVLQGVSLDVAEGEAAVLLGRNGAGKTTTISALVGFLRPRSGSVLVRGRDLTGAPPHVVARAGVALVPQGRRMFADLSVREHLTLTARPATVSPFTNVHSRSRCAGSSEAEGSSRASTGGSPSSPAATFTRWRLPPERFSRRSPARSASPACSSICCTEAAGSATFSRCAKRLRFSVTDSLEYRAGC